MESRKVDECSLKVQHLLKILIWCRNDIGSCASEVAAVINSVESAAALDLGGGPYLWGRSESTDGSLYASAEVATPNGSLELYVGTTWSARSWHVVGEIRLLAGGGEDAVTLWRDERHEIVEIDGLARQLLAVKEGLVAEAKRIDAAHVLRPTRG